MRALSWTDAARQFQARVALMRQLEPDAGWPDLSDETLVAALTPGSSPISKAPPASPT
jgi:ATP-dependent helicase HrpB